MHTVRKTASVTVELSRKGDFKHKSIIRNI